jgi:hypothetical protein
MKQHADRRAYGPIHLFYEHRVTECTEANCNSLLCPIAKEIVGVIFKFNATEYLIHLCKNLLI